MKGNSTVPKIANIDDIPPELAEKYLAMLDEVAVATLRALKAGTQEITRRPASEVISLELKQRNSTSCTWASRTS